jgi:hypothetical protein
VATPKLAVFLGKTAEFARSEGKLRKRGAPMESLWAVINIVGPLLLIIALVVVFLRNRRARRGEIEQAEQGARALREQLDREEGRRER